MYLISKGLMKYQILIFVRYKYFNYLNYINIDKQNDKDIEGF